MLLYYNSKGSLYRQYKKTSDILNNEKSSLDRKYDTLLECLNSFNSVLQADNDLDDLESLIELLEIFKELLNSIKANIKDLESLIESFNKIFPKDFNYSTIISKEIKSKIHNYNLKAKTCQQEIDQSAIKYDDFIMQYIKISLPILQSSSNVNSVDDDLVEIHKELAEYDNYNIENDAYVDDDNLSEEEFSEIASEIDIVSDNIVENVSEDDIDNDDDDFSDNVVENASEVETKADNDNDNVSDDVVEIDSEDETDVDVVLDNEDVSDNNVEVNSDNETKAIPDNNSEEIVGLDNAENNAEIVSNDDSNSKTQKPKFTLDLVGSNKDYPTLVISEKYQKVYLPFSKSELQKKLDENKNYKNYQDVIDAEYTLPMSRFKNPKIARFQEAYNLMKKKEKASLLESIDLALEVSFNNSLYPAIITACDSLDELDTYIDCIEKNELDKFEKFKVVFEVAPL